MALFDFLKLRKRGGLEKQGPASRRQKKRDDETKTMRRRSGSGPNVTAVIWIIIIWASCCFSVVYRPRSIPDLVVGQKAPHYIFAETAFQVTDEEATNQARENAKAGVANVYRYNKKALSVRKSRLKAIYKRLGKINKKLTGSSSAETPPKNRGDEAVAPSDPHLEIIYRLIPKEAEKAKPLIAFLQKEGVIEDILQNMSTEGDAAWTPVIGEVRRTSNPLITFKREGVRRVKAVVDLATPRDFAKQLLDKYQAKVGLTPDVETVSLARRILEEAIEPDLNFHARDTATQRELAAKLVQPIRHIVRKDEAILTPGEKVTKLHKAKIRVHAEELSKDERHRELFLMRVVSRTSWCLWATIGWMFMLFAMLPKVCRRRSNISLIGLVITVNILLLWLTNHLMLNIFNQAPRFVYPALPMAFAAIVLAILLKPNVGMLAGSLVAVLYGMQADNGALVTVYGIIASVTGALAVKSVRTRSQIFRAAAYVPVFSFLILSIYMATNMHPAINYPICLGIAVLSGIATVIVVNLVMPFLEWVFGITTDISLLELSDLNHPLLKRLSLEAPGTYAHTMMVATLAEHAAEAIGANTLLTRVMSYFHDIGKLSNPSYFTENSFEGNMHEDLSTKMSVRIILNHVKEGLNMAARYKLKAPLREAIATHHGNSLVYYFYHRAKTDKTLEAAGGEAEYRYPGPNPRSPEATIISLTDSCEAASRSLQKPTPQKIDSLVDDIFKGKLFGGQLDETSLRMDELTTVCNTIKKTLRVMLHSRIAYPKNEEIETKVLKAGFAEKSREITQSRTMSIRNSQKETVVEADASEKSHKNSKSAVAPPASSDDDEEESQKTDGD